MRKEGFSAFRREYILLHFQDDPSKYDSAITEIMTMKQNISTPYVDVETACLLKRYYAQLLMMKNRFPMEEGDPIKVLFSWYDRAMDIAHSATYDDVGFELACVMYNIGAVHAAVAVNESRENEDSIKNAFMHYQYAAWPLQHLRDKLNASKYASVDFDKELLTFFINVLLGQAQECLLEKSLIDHRSNLVVAKLAIHLRDRYQECLRHIENSNLCDYVSSQKYKQWSRTCAIKSEMYGAIAMIHTGCQADDDKKMGARYGYYKIANEHLTAILKLAEKEDRDTMRASISFLSDVVGNKLNNAKKENEFIYHDRVPGPDELCKDLEGLCKVRPLSFDPLDPSVGGEDLFGGLLPSGVVKAVSEYEEEKAKLKREVLERINSKDDELESNNVELHKAIAAHTTNLHLLSLPIAELTSKLAGPAINAGSTPEGAALRRLLDKTREMQTQRAQLVQRLTDEMNNDNIAKKLLSERDSDHRETFVAELKKHEETIKYIDANLSAQEKILSALTEANADFSDFRKKIKASLNTRSEQIMTLVTAYDVYSDVCSKVEDGRNFYMKLLDRLNKLTLAVEGIEAAFGAEREKRAAEKRSLEEKMAALKRATEARDALADFAVGGAAQPPLPVAPGAVRGGRPRLGDYMEFYRNKMAAGGVPQAGYVPPPASSMAYQPPIAATGRPDVFYGVQPGMPPQIQPMHPGAVVGPPSPAPSSIPESTAYSTHHLQEEVGRPAPMLQQMPYSHVSPVPGTSLAAQAVAQNPALSLPAHLQAPAAPRPQQVPAPAAPAHIHSQPYAPQAVQAQTNHTHVPLSTQHQPAPMPQYQQYPGAGNVPTPAVATPIASINAAAAAGQWNTMQQQIPGQIMPTSQVQNFPAHSVAPIQSQGLPYAPPGPQYLGGGVQRPPEQYHVPPIPGQQPLPTTMQPQQNPVQPAANMLPPQQASQYPQQPPVSTMPSSSQGTVGSQIVPAMPPSGPMPPPQAAPFAPAPASIPMGSQPAQPAAVPPQPEQKPLQQRSTNPFNRLVVEKNCRISAWAMEHQRHLDDEVQTQVPPPQPAQKPFSNVDLLDGILDNTNLPPAMIPQPKSMENQNLLRASAPSSSVSTESVTLSAIHRLPDKPAPVQVSQPSTAASASAVIAGQTQPAPVQDMQPVQNQAQASKVLPLSELMDPSKFELGPGDKTRLEKRLLHEHIRSGGDTPLPQLDPNDPLNSLDPFWKTR
ncbi:BRO1-like domain protein [Ancylostoma ceylanicum]|uniref:BRO1-like domain protein n=1 Tax=Ancylostoma ceylanicum TaxID=53326 RepID=A0A0D6L7X7_9BILA|nr:BRO1-like domain protein [Ancylostoma ceylanicum]